MAVAIRLKRVGKKKHPIYKIVVQDSRNALSGNVLEEVGVYNPCVEPAVASFKTELLKSWIAKGAQPSETVLDLMKAAKVA